MSWPTALYLMPSGIEMFLPFRPSTLVTKANSLSKLFSVNNFFKNAVSKR